MGMAFVAFGNLWEGILYFDRIYEIQNGHLLEIHNTQEEKDEANHKKSTVSAVVTFTVSHADTGRRGIGIGDNSAE